MRIPRNGTIGRAQVRLVPRQRKPARQDGSPPVASVTHVEREPARCERCEAVYQRKTWRVGRRTRRQPFDRGTPTLCPACAQLAKQEYFGRVYITRPLSEEREREVRRRVSNVERRARHTQPERRLVSLAHASGRLEILTTSQKLAHRIAHELEKAFGGRAHYVWTNRERVLEATWNPEAEPKPGARAPRQRTHEGRRDETAGSGGRKT